MLLVLAAVRGADPEGAVPLVQDDAAAVIQPLDAVRKEDFTTFALTHRCTPFYLVPFLLLKYGHYPKTIKEWCHMAIKPFTETLRHVRGGNAARRGS